MKIKSKHKTRKSKIIVAILKISFLLIAIEIFQSYLNTNVNLSIAQSISKPFDMIQIILLALLIFLILSFIIGKIISYRWLGKHKSIEDIKNLNWREFEKLCSLAFEKRGWKVRENTTGGADGGIDLILSKRGATQIVQCKQWKGRVGAPVVREMYGLLHHHRASKVIIMATGGYTKEAYDFAKGKPIELMDGEDILELLGHVRVDEHKEREYVRNKILCPTCNQSMVRRKNKKFGNYFWGCSNYPKCKGTRRIT